MSNEWRAIDDRKRFYYSYILYEFLYILHILWMILYVNSRKDSGSCFLDLSFIILSVYLINST